VCKIDYKDDIFRLDINCEVIKMEDKKKEKKTESEGTREFPDRDHPQKYHAPESRSAINNPARELPAYNPPVPNRAWTAMRQDLASSNVLSDFTVLTPEEQVQLKGGLRD
jgi:hypothetical protein